MIYTHSGIFHGDDVFAVAVLKMNFPSAQVCRVRELPENFDWATDIAVDVGGKYDPSKNMFDHHQKGGQDDGLAAIGKVWKSFGIILCGSTDITDRVWETLLVSINDADIGVQTFAPIEGRRHLSASALISSCNPPFGTPEETVSSIFIQMVDMAIVSLTHSIAQAMEWVNMKTAVSNAAIHSNGRILQLSCPGPWQEHIFNQGLDDVLYVIYPSDRGGFLCQCVPDSPGSFGQRKPLPASWAGLRGDDLKSIANLNLSGPATFCHPGSFICGAESITDCLKLASLAVEA